MDYDLIDQILEQCIWVCTHTSDGRKNIYYEKDTGIIINYIKSPVTKNTTLSSFPIDVNESKIYNTYIQNLRVSKEKAYIMCQKSGVFESHHLIKQKYWSLSSKINKIFIDSYPELLI